MAQSYQPRPLFFVSRSNGLLVPLIPADELPFNVSLPDVPRAIEFAQKYGVMKDNGSAPDANVASQLESDVAKQCPDRHSLAVAHARSQSSSSSVDSPVNPVATQVLADALTRQNLVQSANNMAGAGWSSKVPQSSLSTGETTDQLSNIELSVSPSSSSMADKTSCISDAVGCSSTGVGRVSYTDAGPRSTTTPCPVPTPDKEKKEYCTYWIRTGECAYAQQGCMYKHEMPNKATLQKIGFRTQPKWWLASQGAMRHGQSKYRRVQSSEKSTVIISAAKGSRRRGKKAGNGGTVDSASSGTESEANTATSNSKSTQSAHQKKVTEGTVVSESPRHIKAMKVSTKRSMTPERSSRISATSARSYSPADARRVSTSSDLIDLALPVDTTLTPSRPL